MGFPDTGEKDARIKALETECARLTKISAGSERNRQDAFDMRAQAQKANMSNADAYGRCELEIKTLKIENSDLRRKLEAYERKAASAKKPIAIPYRSGISTGWRK